MYSTNMASDADYNNAVLDRLIKHKFVISSGLASLLQRRKPIRSVMYSERMICLTERAGRGHWRGPNSHPNYAGGWAWRARRCHLGDHDDAWQRQQWIVIQQIGEDLDELQRNGARPSSP